ncbi:ABC transporter ATP-binding protein [Streptomyces sp. NPDC006476]|uniref:ABC transporter ATP-binding protein n=1 Tax=Streptomyces sp. NPDC006476 TaxID=3157175 RepID=UPI0033A3F72E
MTALAASGARLEVSALHASYGSGEVLHGLDFHVEAGEAVVLLGANGAGKTTTLRALSGMVRTRGSAVLDGQRLLGRPVDHTVRLGVAHVPQGRGVFGELTVEENLRAGAYLRRDRAGVETDLAHWYEVFPRLAERRTQQAGGMSGGEQQMLAVARALMSRPRLLMLDEPSLGLARIITRRLFDQLGEINREQGTSMLIVEQNAELALAFAHRAYVLESGRLVRTGTAAEVRADDGLRRAYLGY